MSHLETGDLLDWIDTIPFSRPRTRHLHRDFSDGTLTAELIHYFFPDMIEVCTYPRTMKVGEKKVNWTILSQKVLNKLDFPLSSDTITQLATSKREATEYFLNTLRWRIDSHMRHRAAEKKKMRPKREADMKRSRTSGRKSVPSKSSMTDSSVSNTKARTNYY